MIMTRPPEPWEAVRVDGISSYTILGPHAADGMRTLIGFGIQDRATADIMAAAPALARVLQIMLEKYCDSIGDIGRHSVAIDKDVREAYELLKRVL